MDAPSLVVGIETSAATTLEKVEKKPAHYQNGTSGDAVEAPSGVPEETASPDCDANNDEVKSVSLNNENDDRVVAIEVVGQGAATTNASDSTAADGAEAGSLHNNGAAVAPAVTPVVDDPKELEQSASASKGSDPVKDTPSTETITGEAHEEAITTNDDVQVDNDADKREHDEKETVVVAALENGQSVVGATSPEVAVELQTVSVVDPEEKADSVGVKTDVKETEEKCLEEEVPVVAVDEPSLVIIEDKEVPAKAVDAKLPVESTDLEDCVETLKESDEVQMESLQLDDSQEIDEEDVEEVVDDEDGEEVKIKLEPSAKSRDQDENDIETIDIDTDDDEDEEHAEDEEGAYEDDEGSLVGPPLDDEDDEEADLDQSVDGDAYEEFEVSDEEQPGEESQEDLDLQLVDEEDDDASGGGTSTDEERFAAMKESNRGAKRKRNAEDEAASPGTKDRKVEWLDSGNSPRMHVMESVCRDAMLRHKNADKIEEINSQDEDAADSDVVVEGGGAKGAVLKALTTPVSNSPVSQKVTETTGAVSVVDAVNAKSAVEVKVNETVAKEKNKERETTQVGDLEQHKVNDRESSSAVKGSSGGESAEEGNKVTVVNAEAVKERSRAEESKDCDKPKSVEDTLEGRTVTVVEDAEVVEVAEKEDVVHLNETEVMDVDSQDSELEDVKRKLPNKDGDTVKENAEQKTSVKVTTIEPETVEVVVQKEAPSGAVSKDGSLEGKKEEGKRKPVEEAPVDNNLKRKLATANSSEEESLSKEKTSSEESERPQDEAEKVDKEETGSTAKRPKLPESAKEQLQRELEANFGRHDRLLREYITKSSGEEGDVQKQVDQLVMEIEALNDMIRTKEMEWNNMIHLKKVKEELVMRLTRKKHVQEILEAPLEQTVTVAQASLSMAGDASTASLFSGSSASSKAAVQANKLIKNLQLSSSLSGAAVTSKTTQSILQNRANMTTEDLEKEKKNTAKLHRHSIQGPPTNSHQSNNSHSASTPVAVGSLSSSSARNSVSPSPNVLSGRASAPAVGGRSKTPTSTPIHAQNDIEQRMAAFERLTAAHAMQAATQEQLLFNSTQLLAAQQQQHQQQYDALQSQAAAAAAVAAGQMVGRQGAIKDVRSIIEDYRQRHPESVPRRGRLQQPQQPQGHHLHQQQQQHQAALAAATQMQQLLQGSGNSLLHGILTKQHNQQQQQQGAHQQSQSQSARALQQQQHQAQQQQQHQAQGGQNGGAAGSGFSPTLARLLTAPERISTVQNVATYQQQMQQQHVNPVMNLSKNMKSEITITPVVSQNHHSGQYNNMQQQMMSMQDDDQDDNSADRLVIDEGIHTSSNNGGGNLLGNNTSTSHVHGQEFHENEVPECQGCKRKEAQFVCAGCGNQWYCSRECQVSAWDEHSETCTG